jgi:hypothetical protein
MLQDYVLVVDKSMDGDVHVDCQAPTHSTFRVARALNSSSVALLLLLLALRVAHLKKDCCKPARRLPLDMSQHFMKID